LRPAPIRLSRAAGKRRKVAARAWCAQLHRDSGASLPDYSSRGGQPRKHGRRFPAQHRTVFL